MKGMKLLRKYWFLVAGVIIIGLNLMVPACGNKGNNAVQGYYGGYNCIPGQQCNVSGTPMFQAPIMTSIDQYGSAAQIQLYASTYTGGGSYNGQIQIQAQVYIAPNGYGCPPGMYYVSGSGNFQANVGGTYGLVAGSMTGGNFAVTNFYGEIYGGQDPAESTPTAYFFMGNFGNVCDPNAKGL